MAPFPKNDGEFRYPFQPFFITEFKMSKKSDKWKMVILVLGSILAFMIYVLQLLGIIYLIIDAFVAHSDGIAMQKCSNHTNPPDNCSTLWKIVVCFSFLFWIECVALTGVIVLDGIPVVDFFYLQASSMLQKCIFLFAWISLLLSVTVTTSSSVYLIIAGLLLPLLIATNNFIKNGRKQESRWLKGEFRLSEVEHPEIANTQNITITSTAFGCEVINRRTYTANLVDIGSRQNVNWQLFRANMDIVACLQHPNLVKLVGVSLVHNRENSIIFLTEPMKESLRSFMSDLPKCIYTHNEKLTISISLDVAQALNHLDLMRLHQYSHQYITSTDVHLNANKRAKLFLRVDFSDQNRMLEITHGDNRVYAAPEVIEALEVNADRKDHNVEPTKLGIYSFGVLLVEMLTDVHVTEHVEHDNTPHRFRELTDQQVTKLKTAVNERAQQDEDAQQDKPPHGFRELKNDCLGKPEQRPSANQVIARLLSLLNLSRNAS